MADIVETLLDAAEYLESYDIQSAVKLRDKREPGRREKTAAELRLMRIMARAFRKQAKKVRAWLEAYYPMAVKTDPVPPDTVFFWDDDDQAALVRELTKALQGGISLFGNAVGVQIDYTLTNVEAALAARRYAYNLIKNVTDTTRAAVRNAVSQFVNTPGFTIGDAMNMMPFGEVRAEMVAVTEVTRAYAEGQKLAGEELKKEFPDLAIVKKWFTNNDDIVCDICGPLDGVTVLLDEMFPGELEEPPAHPRCRCWTSVTTDIMGKKSFLLRNNI